MITAQQFIREGLYLLPRISALVICLGIAGICSEASAIHNCGCKSCGEAAAAPAEFTCGDDDASPECGCPVKEVPVVEVRDPKFCNLPVPNYPAPIATPRPTVPTHLTYGPFMPHNSLPNYRGTYLIPQPNGGPGGTQVHWRSQKGINALKRVHKAFEWAR